MSNSPTLPSIYHRQAWRSPLLVPPSAVEACAEAEAREEEVKRVTKEHKAAEAAIFTADRDHTAAVRAAVEAGKPSPPSEAAALAATCDALAVRLAATIDVKAEACKKAARALEAAAPEMLESLPADIEAVLATIDAEGLTEERAAEVGRLLAGVLYYRTLSTGVRGTIWRPVTVEMPACVGIDAVAIHRSAAQTLLARITSRGAL